MMLGIGLKHFRRLFHCVMPVDPSRSRRGFQDARLEGLVHMADRVPTGKHRPQGWRPRPLDLFVLGIHLPQFLISVLPGQVSARFPICIVSQHFPTAGSLLGECEVKALGHRELRDACASALFEDRRLRVVQAEAVEV